MSLLTILYLLPSLIVSSTTILLWSDSSNLLKILIKNSEEPKDIAFNEFMRESDGIKTDFDLKKACEKTPFLLFRFQSIGESSPAPLSIDNHLRMFYTWKCDRKGNKNLQRTSYAPKRALWTPKNIADQFSSVTVEEDKAEDDFKDDEKKLVSRYLVSLGKNRRNLLQRNR